MAGACRDLLIVQINPIERSTVPRSAPEILDRLAADGLFRVVLIHHPPLTTESRFKRLTDAAAFQAMIRRVGCEIVLPADVVVARTRPKLASGGSLSAWPENTVSAGGAKFARLKTLNTSARNCSVPLPPSLTFFTSDRSKFVRPGPRMMPTPALPNEYGALA